MKRHRWSKAVFKSAFYIVTCLFGWLWCVFMVFDVIPLLFVNPLKNFLWFTDCLTIGVIHETMVVHMYWVWTFFNNYIYIYMWGRDLVGSSYRLLDANKILLTYIQYQHQLNIRLMAHRMTHPFHISTVLSLQIWVRWVLLGEHLLLVNFIRAVVGVVGEGGGGVYSCRECSIHI